MLCSVHGFISNSWCRHLIWPMPLSTYWCHHLTWQLSSYWFYQLTWQLSSYWCHQLIWQLSSYWCHQLIWHLSTYCCNHFIWQLSTYWCHQPIWQLSTYWCHHPTSVHLLMPSPHLKSITYSMWNLMWYVWLQDNSVEYNTAAPSGSDCSPTCQVMEQKEMPNGLQDEPCQRPVPLYYAGLCEYVPTSDLVSLSYCVFLKPCTCNCWVGCCHEICQETIHQATTYQTFHNLSFTAVTGLRVFVYPYWYVFFQHLPIPICRRFSVFQVV